MPPHFGRGGQLPPCSPAPPGSAAYVITAITEYTGITAITEYTATAFTLNTVNSFMHTITITIYDVIIMQSKELRHTEPLPCCQKLCLHAHTIVLLGMWSSFS